MENLIPAWPDAGEEDFGVFFTWHDVEEHIPFPDRIVPWIESVLDEEGIDLSRLDFVFCSDAFLLEMNSDHLGHDEYTDILTFPLNENPLIGEIYISTDRVRENAGQLNISFDRELARVIIHGVLHLCGYDDHEEADIRQIRQKEDKYLQTLEDAADQARQRKA